MRFADSQMTAVIADTRTRMYSQAPCRMGDWKSVHGGLCAPSMATSEAYLQDAKSAEEVQRDNQKALLAAGFLPILIALALESSQLPVPLRCQVVAATCSYASTSSAAASSNRCSLAPTCHRLDSIPCKRLSPTTQQLLTAPVCRLCGAWCTW